MKTLKLNNGVEMPALGLGVFQSKPEETSSAVKTALENGYRLIDTAAAYFNEKEVGAGMRESEVQRSDIFLTTKLWISDYSSEDALKGFEASLRRLGTDYLDLYLLHQPMPRMFDKTLSAYKVAERLLKEGRVKAIGVCNFSEQHLTNLMKETEVIPALNQVELNPFFIQKELRNFHEKYGIATQAWSPIGGINVYWNQDPENSKNVLKHPTILKIADKYSRTPAQIILRWHLENNISAIPKSVKNERIKENFDVFNFSLSLEDVSEINKLDTGVRSGPNPEMLDTTTYTKKVDNNISAD